MPDCQPYHKTSRLTLRDLSSVLLVVLWSILLAGCAQIQEMSQSLKLERPVISSPGPGLNDNIASAYQYYYLPDAKPKLSENMRFFFYNKAWQAAEGLNVHPVIVPDIHGHPEEQEDLLEDREVLTRHLNRDHRLADHQLLAQAQAAYDCSVLFFLKAFTSGPEHQNPDNTALDKAQLCHKRYQNLISRIEKPIWPRLEYHVFFQSGRSVLEREAIEILRKIAEYKKQDPYAVLIIAGNSDQRGGAAANRRLSIQRARAVRNILLQFGIRENEIEVLETGDNFPAFFALENGQSAELQRRVSILVKRKLIEQPDL